MIGVEDGVHGLMVIIEERLLTPGRNHTCSISSEDGVPIMPESSYML